MYDSRDPWGRATEAEWSSEETPAPLLEVVRGHSDRKARLFACECCRRVWDLLSEPERDGVEIAERYAEGSTSEDERWDRLKLLLESVGADVHREVGSCSWAVVENGQIPNAVIAALLTDSEVLVCGQTGRSIRGTSGGGMAYRAIFCADLSVKLLVRQIAPTTFVQDRWVSRVWRQAVQRVTGLLYLPEGERKWWEAIRCESNYQADLVRDLFGNPFRPASFSPDWRTDTAVSLARTMYEARDFSAMPILADALQDAGCDNDDILSHCRDANATHVRGCWVVDSVLGKV